MKIAMIGLRGIPATSGGVEMVVEKLAPRLVKLGYEVTVYCRTSYCPKRPKTFKGVKLVYLPTINTKATEAFVHSALCTIHALFCRYDIVHYHAMGNGLFSIIPRIKPRTKTVVTLHGLDWEREKWGFVARMFLRFCERAIAKLPNKVISVSQKIQTRYKKKFKKDIIFIPNGVEVEKTLALKQLRRFGLQKDKYILFLSRLVPEKGIHTLINSFKKVKTDVKLVIAGSPTHTQDYFQKIQNLANGDKRIIFTGPLYGKDKTEAFSNCLFFVLPSTIEGMPIVLLEAMSFAKCPLISNIEENVAVVGENGFHFKVNSENSLQKQLSFMLKHPKILKQKGQLCKKIVRSEYDWETISQSTKEVYEGLFNAKKS